MLDIWKFLHHLFPHSFSLSLYSFLSWPEPAAKLPGGKKKNKSVFTVFLNLSPGLWRIWQGFTNLWENPCGDLRKPASLLKKESCVGQKLGKNWSFHVRFLLRFWIWTWSCTLRIKFCSDQLWIYTGANTSQSELILVCVPVRTEVGSKCKLTSTKAKEEPELSLEQSNHQGCSSLWLWFSPLSRQRIYNTQKLPISNCMK